MCTNNHKNGRRAFMKKMGLFTGATFMFSNMPFRVFTQTPLIPQENKKRILVLIQLAGGNDGLNTIIPTYDFGTYKRQRPTLHVPKEESIILNNDFSIPESMKPFKKMWDKKMVKIINNVGNPFSDLSHFYSTDLWQGGISDRGDKKHSGWMGRYLEIIANASSNSFSTHPPAIQLGEDSGLVFQGDKSQYGFFVDQLDEFEELIKEAELHEIENNEWPLYKKELDFIKETSNNIYNYSGTISRISKEGKNEVHYENNPLSAQLKTVAKLIKGGLNTSIYHVSLDGFDTHAQQKWKHRELLSQLSNAVFLFYADLKKKNMHENVTTMTYSEFGRRIEENGSRGTDHGTSAPVFIFNGDFGKSEIIGEPADLKNPDEDGNLIYNMDFRRVYSTILDQWLGVGEDNIEKILYGKFNPIAGLI